MGKSVGFSRLTYHFRRPMIKEVGYSVSAGPAFVWVVVIFSLEKHGEANISTEYIWVPDRCEALNFGRISRVGRRKLNF